jgi:hypothetical protein
MPETWFLLHDNAPAHRSLVVYKSAIIMKGQQFASAKDVIAKANRSLEGACKNGFQECFQNLYERWHKCATTPWNYSQEHDV